jgi:site-specific DNA-adenine methylase
MPISHFIIQYKGNKRLETSTILPIINFNNKKNIIEPFCGTSAMSFAIWQQYGNQFNYYLNDIDEKLIEVYNLLKIKSIKEIEENIENIRLEYNALQPDLIIPEKRTLPIANNKQKEFLKNIEKNPRNIYDYLFMKRFCTYGMSGFPPSKHHGIFNKYKITNPLTLKIEFIEFIKSPNVFISNNDYKIIYEEHRNNPKSIILLDPPYVNTDKRFYQSNDNEIYSYFTNNPIKKNKASTYVIVDDNWIMRIIFKDCNILSVYDKEYSSTKKNKKVKHIIFSNKSTPSSSSELYPSHP